MIHPYAWTLWALSSAVEKLNRSRFAPMEKWIDAGFAPSEATTIKEWMAQSVIVYGLLTAYRKANP